MNIKSNFTYNGNQPNFTRDIYQTKADMAAAKATRLPQMYVASCLEDGNIYVYNKANEDDPETGKWRVLKSGGEIQVDSEISAGSGNPVSGAAVSAGISAEAASRESGDSALRAELGSVSDELKSVSGWLEEHKDDAQVQELSYEWQEQGKANSLLELSDGSWLKCTDSELQRSDDNGESWTAVYSTGAFQNLQEVGGGVVLAGSDNSNESGEHGILRSEDYGKTWTKTRTDSTWEFRGPLELGGKTVVLALAYALDSNGTDYSLVSEDGGKTWKPISGLEEAIGNGNAKFCPEIDTVFYSGKEYVLSAGASGEDTVYKWTIAELGFTIYLSPVYIKKSGSILLSSSDGGIYRYAAGGASEKITGLHDGAQYELYKVVDTAEESVVLALSSSASYRSTDGGSTWADISLPSGGARVISTGSDGVVLVNISSAIYRSEDKGETWSLYSTAPYGSHIIAAPDGRIFSASSDKVAVSSGGAGWTQIYSNNNGRLYNITLLSGSIPLLLQYDYSYRGEKMYSSAAEAIGSIQGALAKLDERIAALEAK